MRMRTKIIVFFLFFLSIQHKTWSDTLSHYSAIDKNQIDAKGLWIEIYNRLKEVSQKDAKKNPKNFFHIADLYFQMKDYDNALFYAVKSLENYKLQANSTESDILNAEVLIARAQIKRKNYKVGMAGLRGILSNYQDNKYLHILLTLYFEMANVYYSDVDSKDSAELYFLKVQSIMNKYTNLFNPYILAEINFRKKKIDKAQGFFAQSITQAAENNNHILEFDSRIGLANCFIFRSLTDSAMAEIDKASSIAEYYDYPYLKLQCYKMYADIYRLHANFDTAYLYFEKYLLLSDSIGTNQINEISERLYNELKLSETKLQTEKLAAENSFQLSIILLLAISFIIGTALGIYMLSLVKKNKRLRSEMEIYTEELQVKSELLVLRADELERLNKEIKAIHQAYKNQMEGKDQIDIKLKEKSKSIMESLLYAKNIQEALFPPENVVSRLFSSFFILWKPREVVSGDFYWYKESGRHIYLALGDCTGHGVPGAFMSMLGISYLNEIISKYSGIDSGKMLDLLNDKILESLNQSGSQKVLRDGMDISLIKIDIQTGECNFAAAYNNAYLVKKNENNTIEVDDLKADRRPIGLFGKTNEAFGEIKFVLTKGTKFYMTSDGYTDQFGGENHKKFMKKRLRDYFVQIFDYPMYYQKIFLNEKFLSWRGSNEQLDDVLLIGLEI